MPSPVPPPGPDYIWLNANIDKALALKNDAFSDVSRLLAMAAFIQIAHEANRKTYIWVGDALTFFHRNPEQFVEDVYESEAEDAKIIGARSNTEEEIRASFQLLLDRGLLEEIDNVHYRVSRKYVRLS